MERPGTASWRGNASPSVLTALGFYCAFLVAPVPLAACFKCVDDSCTPAATWWDAYTGRKNCIEREPPNPNQPGRRCWLGGLPCLGGPGTEYLQAPGSGSPPELCSSTTARRSGAVDGQVFEI